MNSTNVVDVLLAATLVIGSLGILLMVAGGIAATILDSDATSEPHPTPRADVSASPPTTTTQQPSGPFVSRGLLRTS
jgi:hypothetical protein